MKHCHIFLAIALALSLALSSAGIRFVSAAPHRAPTNDFVIKVKTDYLSTGSSNSTQFIIPTKGGGYNYNVDCDNDGSDEATGQTGSYTCDYGTGNEPALIHALLILKPLPP